MNETLSSTLRRILAGPWQQRRNRNGLWVILLIVALCCSLSVAMLAWSLFENAELSAVMRHSAAVSGRIALLTLALAWWAVMVANVLEQNHPTFARLVPDHPTRLRLALLAGGAGMVLFASGVLHADVADPLACAVCAALALALVAVGVRWQLLLVVAGVLSYGVVVALDTPAVVDAIASGLPGWHQHRLGLSAAGFAAAIVLLGALIQDGGSRHAANYAARCDRAQRTQAALRGEQPLPSRRRGPLARVIHSPYHAWLRHVLASPRSSPRARATLGLGPGLHWTRPVIAVVAATALILGGIAVLELVGLAFPVVGGFVPIVVSSIAIGAMFGVLSPALQVQSRLRQTQREQALLALLPGVPRRGASNRWLAWELSGQFLLAWLGGLAIMLLFSELARHLGRPSVDVSYGDARTLMALASLPLVTLQWRGWARLSEPSSLDAGGPALMGLVLAVVACIGKATGRFTLAEAAVAFALGALAWCALRWWRMGREPSAFPVGRLA